MDKEKQPDKEKSRVKKTAERKTAGQRKQLGKEDRGMKSTAGDSRWLTKEEGFNS